MKSVLISIRPKWCGLIANGQKTVEIRKTKPKAETPFKCYIYCTKDFSLGELYTSGELMADSVQGKVIGEFVCDKLTCFTTDYRCNAEMVRKISEESCVCIWDLSEYEGNSNCLWAWHISNLKIYDKPKELSDFKHCGVNYHHNPPITRPPQSWCYVEVME